MSKVNQRTIEFRVRLSAGSYVTSKVLGVTASSAEGAQAAAARLGLKALGASFVHAEKLRNSGEAWKLHAEEHCAWAWQSGLIEIGPEAPDGALKFAVGFDRPLRVILELVARHGMGKSEGKLLVPGVPEADSPRGKVDALIAFTEWCARSNGEPRWLGVKFIRSEEEAHA